MGDATESALRNGDRGQLETQAVGAGGRTNSVGSARAELVRRDREYAEEQERSRREFEREMSAAADAREASRQKFDEALAQRQMDHASELASEQLATARGAETAAKWAATAAVLSVVVAMGAGWLSLDAAYRQEEATYASQLYNKQVDTIAALTRSVQDNVLQIDEIYQDFLAMRTAKTDLTSQIIDAIRRRESNAFDRFHTDFQTTWLVVPNEVKSKLNDLHEAVNGFWNKITEAETSQDLNLTEEYRLYMKNQISSLAARLGDCASWQLSSGRSLQGDLFEACFEERPPR